MCSALFLNFGLHPSVGADFFIFLYVHFYSFSLSNLLFSPLFFSMPVLREAALSNPYKGLGRGVRCLSGLQLEPMPKTHFLCLQLKNAFLYGMVIQRWIKLPLELVVLGASHPSSPFSRSGEVAPTYSGKSAMVTS